jgi:hypothetical protein
MFLHIAGEGVVYGESGYTLDHSFNALIGYFPVAPFYNAVELLPDPLESAHPGKVPAGIFKAPSFAPFISNILWALLLEIPIGGRNSSVPKVVSGMSTIQVEPVHMHLKEEVFELSPFQLRFDVGD